MIDEIKNIKSTKKELRSFGITIGAVLAIFGAVFWWQQKSSFIYFFEGSLILLLLGFLFPIVLKPLQKVWMTIAVIIGYVMTRVILSVLFYLIITPLGLVSKLCGNKFLDLEINKTQNSYWICREESVFNKERYEKQF